MARRPSNPQPVLIRSTRWRERIEESPDGAGSYMGRIPRTSCRRRLRPPILAFPFARTDWPERVSRVRRLQCSRRAADEGDRVAGGRAQSGRGSLPLGAPPGGKARSRGVLRTLVDRGASVKESQEMKERDRSPKATGSGTAADEGSPAPSGLRPCIRRSGDGASPAKETRCPSIKEPDPSGGLHPMG
jgi:hypothetical protein